jgi:hypothetical protein
MSRPLTNGQRDAFEVGYLRYRKIIAYVARQKGPSRGSAREFEQTLVVRLLEKFPYDKQMFATPGNLRTALNQAVNHIRTRGGVPSKLPASLCYRFIDKGVELGEIDPVERTDFEKVVKGMSAKKRRVLAVMIQKGTLTEMARASGEGLSGIPELIDEIRYKIKEIVC